ncbi:MAG: efflux RND transporter permease subunit [Pseudomonadota bacterium]
MTGIVQWAADHARMVLAFIVLSIVVGGYAYVSLPKEGEPDIEIPAVFISVPFPGISAEDAEKLLVKPMETEMADLDGLKTMTGTAVEGYANLVLEFEFGWDKSGTLADVRAAMDKAEASFPAGAENYTVDEFNFSEFPIIIVNLSGPLPERTLLQIANDLQTELESLEPVLEASLAGHRDEMVEVVIDPLRLEAYNVTAGELINAVTQNNQLIAAGDIETASGAFAVKIPSSFDETRDIYALPVKVNGDRVITLGDLTEINLTFEDRAGTARFNGENTVALQVVKRKGFNIIDTANLVRQVVAEEQETWPAELSQAVIVGTSNDTSGEVKSMVQQLEGSVLTAIALVMIVVLAALGPRPALLVGFSIPTSFMLCFLLLAVIGIPISNIVMFGLILAVGMLVDGAVVVVEYADRRIREGAGPMRAYVDAAQRMFWPIVSSTATTLCAFLPMLFWPGVPGEFMGMLPVTLIFVLSASLISALIFLPVMGGVMGRMTRSFGAASDALRATMPWVVRAVLAAAAMYATFLGAMQVLNPAYLFGPALGGAGSLVGAAIFILAAIATSITLDAARVSLRPRRIRAGYRRTPFGHLTKLIAGNPVMPIVVIVAVGFFVVTVFGIYGQNNRGVEFFVETTPEQAIVYVRARGNLSLDEKDALVHEVEDVILETQGIKSAFAFAGEGGLNANTGGSSGPRDAIGQVQIEMVRWDDRPRISEPVFLFGVHVLDREIIDPAYDGKTVMARLQDRLDLIPGIYTEVTELAQGPAQGKPVHLRISGEDIVELQAAVDRIRAQFEATPGLIDVEDTLPLPGIDWQIDVDVEKAGRFGADVATVGAMVQLVTRGILLDTMRVPTSEEEIEIRVRLPEEDRLLSTLDTLKVRTGDGLVPLSNFITRTPVNQLGRIDRVDQARHYDVKADVTAGLVRLMDGDGEMVAVVPAVDTEPGGAWEARIADAGLQSVPINANERIAVLTDWVNDSGALEGLDWEWTGDQEEQQESQDFLSSAFAAALALMFVILLAQFNSFYNAALVLVAVVLSTTGVLIGMLVMEQPFSIIMTGTGIVALAGIVVNNNIVLIDTYQELSAYMPKQEAIVRTAEQRIRPVLLTTITTMAGLTPMMFGVSLDFFGGGYSIDSPTALWWKQLATAVVFGLGIATVLTLVLTPSLLALRVWAGEGAYRSLRGLGALISGRDSQIARDVALTRAARRTKAATLVFDPADFLPALPGPAPALAIEGAAPAGPPASSSPPAPARAETAAAATRTAKPLDGADPGPEVQPEMPPEPPLRAAE